jgi:hypothetical protein
VQKYHVIAFCKVFHVLTWVSCTTASVEVNLEATFDFAAFTSLRDVDVTKVSESNIIVSEKGPLVEHLRRVLNWLRIRLEWSKNMI